ncbi:MAG: site-specific integrase, partial [Pyrinomonadaceae bacterium]
DLTTVFKDSRLATRPASFPCDNLAPTLASGFLKTYAWRFIVAPQADASSCFSTEGSRRLYVIDERCDFIEPVKLYLDHLAALEKSPHTLENYCRHLARYFAFLEREQVAWRSVRPDDLVHFIQWLRDRTRRNESYLSERTVNTIVAAVSSFYRYHIQRGTQLENPVLYEQISDRFSKFKRFLVHLGHGKTVKRSFKLKEPERRIKTVKDSDFAQFFSSTENLQFRCMLLLMREGGLRIGEVLGLWLQDIEFHRNGVWVRRRGDLDNDALAKNMREGEQRFVDLSPGLMALLDHLVELDWVVSNLRRLSLPWGYCLHHAKAPKCPYGQNACFTKDNGPCHKLVTTRDHAAVITTTLEDQKRSRTIAQEKGWEMHANDLGDQISGMQTVLSELEPPEEGRGKNRGGQR